MFLATDPIQSLHNVLSRSLVASPRISFYLTHVGYVTAVRLTIIANSFRSFLIHLPIRSLSTVFFSFLFFQMQPYATLLNLVCIAAVSCTVLGHPFSFLPRYAVERAAERRSTGRQVVEHSSNFLTPLTEYKGRGTDTKVTRRTDLHAGRCDVSSLRLIETEMWRRYGSKERVTGWQGRLLNLPLMGHSDLFDHEL